MAKIILINQAAKLQNCQAFKTLATNQLRVRKIFLEKLNPGQLRKLYRSGKDPVLNELFDIYKGLDKFFSGIREER